MILCRPLRRGRRSRGTRATPTGPCTAASRTRASWKPTPRSWPAGGSFLSARVVAVARMLTAVSRPSIGPQSPPPCGSSWPPPAPCARPAPLPRGTLPLRAASCSLQGAQSGGVGCVWRGGSARQGTQLQPRAPAAEPRPTSRPLRACLPACMRACLRACVRARAATFLAGALRVQLGVALERVLPLAPASWGGGLLRRRRGWCAEAHTGCVLQHTPAYAYPLTHSLISGFLAAPCVSEGWR